MRDAGHPRRFAALAALSCVVITATGCGGSAADASPPSGSATAIAGALTGPLTVFAAASLTEAFTAAKTTLEATRRRLSITYSFAGSQTLVAQVQNGAPADVIATADIPTMQTLVGAGLVDAPQTFAHNKLEIVVAPGNPKHVTGLADLARAGLKVVLEDPSVPAGKYARQALAAARVTVTPVSEPLDVKSELLAVEDGDANAGIVYVTDVRAAGSAVSGVAIPDGENVIATYPIAVVRTTSHPAAARAFVMQMVSGLGQTALRDKGFLAP